MPLPLAQSNRAKTFRAIETLIRQDATLKRVLHVVRSWEGKPDDFKPIPTNKVGLRLTPAPGPAEFWSPNIQRSALYIDIDVQVPGTAVDDLLNLWGAVERAIYPADGPTAMAHVATLQAAAGTGASGMVQFSQPARIAARDKDGAVALEATAQLAIEVYTAS